MKKFMIAVVAVMFSISLNVAQAVTGSVLTDNVALDKDLTIYQDYSIYPGKIGEVGKIVRFYDFAKLGGATSTVYNLLPAIKLKNNTVVRDGYIKVMSPLVPLVSTNSMGLNSADDIKASSTNLLNTADTILAVVPVGTVATYKQATNDLYVTFTLTEGAVTNGKFMVVLDVELAP